MDENHMNSREEERRIRDAALDKTIEATFPASDPASSIPDPHDSYEYEREYKRTA